MAAALSFDAPAARWLEALPLGDGHLGAMVFGDPSDERIALNEATLWSGSPLREDEHAVPAEVAQAAVADARRAVLERRFGDATTAVQRLQSRWSQTFLPLGDLRLTFRDASGAPLAAADYARRLDLATATHEVGFGGVRRIDRITDGVLTVEVVSDEPIDLAVTFDSELAPIGAADADGRLVRLLRAPSDVPPPHEPDHGVSWSEAPGDAVRAAVVVGWTHDGAPGGAGRVRGARLITIALAVDTTFRGIGQLPGDDVEAARSAAEKRVADALAAGADRSGGRHADLFSRVSVRLPGAELDETLFHYGRYLLLASSRAGGVPATLQGIWNDRLRPPWSSNYTTNINTEMNYWAADAVALPETLDPLFDLLDALAVRGADTAARLYGAGGWTAHHNSDAWAYTSPVGCGTASPQWAFWPMAGAWLSLALAEHVRHGAGAAFALDRAFPILRGAARFVLDWIVEHDGTPTTAPSTSPENTFLAGGDAFAVGRSATMDLALAAELFDALAEVAAVAGVEDEILAEAATVRARLPRTSAGRDGLIPEWADDDPQAEPGHRHISHLFGLYPGTSLRDPDQLTAAAASLDDRGDDSTGWSLVWKIAARARLRDRDAVDRLLALVFRDAPVPIPGTEEHGQRGGLYPNLFAAHPPFQIDGNLGYLAAVVECLVQSHTGTIALLPALPRRWPAGTVSGLVARPGVRVDLTWADGELVEATLTPLADAARTVIDVEIAGAVVPVDLRAGAVTVHPHPEKDPSA